ncbi:hypothetical protein CR513_59747, partial [Mucuna pruriens]
MTTWSVELSEFALKFKLRGAIKTQALANLKRTYDGCCIFKQLGQVQGPTRGTRLDLRGRGMTSVLSHQLTTDGQAHQGDVQSKGLPTLKVLPSGLERALEVRNVRGPTCSPSRSRIGDGWPLFGTACIMAPPKGQGRGNQSTSND